MRCARRSLHHGESHTISGGAGLAAIGAARLQPISNRSAMRCARRSLHRGKSHTISSGSELEAGRNQAASYTGD
jgi:predicted nucleic acid-binding protein